MNFFTLFAVTRGESLCRWGYRLRLNIECAIVRVRESQPKAKLCVTAHQSLSVLRPCLTIGCVVKTVVDVRGVVRGVGAVVVHVDGATVVVLCEKAIRIHT